MALRLQTWVIIIQLQVKKLSVAKQAKYKLISLFMQSMILSFLIRNQLTI